MYNKRQTGHEKELVAAKYLQGKGIKVLEMNFFTKFGEIDIVAKDGEYLVFAEVKYRTDDLVGFPIEAVSYGKQKNITSAALYYMMKKRLMEDTPVRFDVISILGKEVTHYKNAFEPIEW